MSTEKDLAKKADAAVATFERIPLGKAWRGVFEQAEAAVGSLRGSACDVVFPRKVEPAGADLFADLEALTGYEDWHINTGDHPGLAALHSSCIESHPMLAKVIRGATMRRRLSEVTAAGAGVRQRPASELVAEALAEFELAVSRQLAERNELEPESTIIAEVVPAFKARIGNARERQEGHARAFLERRAKERAEADEVLKREAEAKQEALDRSVSDAEKIVVKKERAAAHAKACLLAARIEALNVETLELEPRSFYSKSEIVGMLRNNQFTRQKIDRISSQVDSFIARKRTSGVRI